MVLVHYIMNLAPFLVLDWTPLASQSMLKWQHSRGFACQWRKRRQPPKASQNLSKVTQNDSQIHENSSPERYQTLPKTIQNLSKIKLGTLIKFRTDFRRFLTALGYALGTNNYDFTLCFVWVYMIFIWVYLFSLYDLYDSIWFYLL